MANTSYQSKSKNTPTGQLPAQVRKRMEEERQKLLDKARAERTRKKGVKRLQGTAAERATAGEFGAAMSPTMSKDDKARASKRSNPKDLRYTGTDAKNKVQAGEAARKNRSRAMEAAAAKRKITQAEAKVSKDPRGNQVKATPGKAKSAAKTWKDYSSIAAAKAAGSLYYSKNGVKKAAVTKSDLDKSGLSLRDYMNYKTGKTRKAAPKKAAPKKAATKKTGMSAGNTVAGKPATNSKTKARNLTLRDKGGVDAKKVRRREEYPVTGPGSQSKILNKKPAKKPVPAGAKIFKGRKPSGYRLTKINGTMYIVPREGKK